MNFFPYHHTGQENKRDKLQQVRREILSYSYATVVTRYEIRKSYNFPRARRYLYSYGMLLIWSNSTFDSVSGTLALLKKKKKKLLLRRFPLKTFLFLSVYFFQRGKKFYRFISMRWNIFFS